MQAQNRSFVHLLNGSTQFIIPVFQRDYSWEEEQCATFFDDVLRGQKLVASDILPSSTNRGHFLGSFVYIDAPGTSAGFTRWLVVDGQQRVTTMTILLIALRDLIGENQDAIELSAEQIDTQYLRNQYQSGEDSRKLRLRREDDHALNALIENHKNIPSGRISDAYEFFRNYLSNEGIREDGESLQVFLARVWAGVESLVVVDVRLEPHIDQPQLVFQSLNSTGVSLTQADLIRNLVLMGLPETEQTDLYDRYWSRMEALFSRDSRGLDDFFRDFLTLELDLSREPRSDNIYTVFQGWFEDKRLDSGGMQPQDLYDLTVIILEDLLRLAEPYAGFRIVNQSDAELEELCSNIRRLTNTPALLIAYLMSEHEKSKLPRDDLLNCLITLESYLVRRAMVGENTRSYLRQFNSIAVRLRDIEVVSSDMLNAQIQLLPESFRFTGDEEFYVALTDNNIYSNNAARYFLERLENHDTKERSDTSGYTIEHILPQNPKLSESWQEMLGSDWADIQQDFVHRLGNLTLTGYNSSYSDRPFEEKKSIAGGFRDSSVRLNKFVREQDQWGKREIIKRGENLADLALTIWPHPGAVDKQLLQKEEMRRLKEREKVRSFSDVEIPSEVRSLFAEFRSMIAGICGDREFAQIPSSKNNTISYYLPQFFCEVIVRKRRITVLVPTDGESLDDPTNLTWDSSEINWVRGATHDYGAGFNLRDITDMQDVENLLRQVFNSVS